MSRVDASPQRVWIDIDNPPQVQYLAPFVEAFAQRGAAVFLTARDHGIAHELLRQRGLTFVGVGAHPGASSAAKTTAVIRRTANLVRRLRHWGPTAAVFATRSGALAAPLLRIPGFALLDYEFVDHRPFRLAGSYVVHPAIVGDALRKGGFSRKRLIAYEGIKEDITFAGVDLDNVEPHRFTGLDSTTAIRVLVRPPDDRSHYHRQASAELTRATLVRLARRDDVVVILSPRYPEQVALLDPIEWRNRPVVLREAVQFLNLLAGVDAVVTGGGTMAREAAYLGLPAYSVFSGELGAVDRFLERSGRLEIIRDLATLDQVRIERRPRAPVLARNPRAIEEIVDSIFEVVMRPRR